MNTLCDTSWIFVHRPALRTTSHNIDQNKNLNTFANLCALMSNGSNVPGPAQASAG